MNAPHTSLSPRRFLQALASVFVGGAAGTGLRDLALKLHPLPAGTAVFAQSGWSAYVPWTLLIINFLGVVGATKLLRTVLRAHDPNNPMRLLVITGFFGGFTSYSSLFMDLDTLWHHSVAGAASVAILAIFSGLAGGWLGLRRWRPA